MSISTSIITRIVIIISRIVAVIIIMIIIIIISSSSSSSSSITKISWAARSRPRGELASSRSWRWSQSPRRQ